MPPLAASSSGRPDRAVRHRPTTRRTGRRGIHPDTASMATVLAARGVVSPITGRPISEALLLVAGGGLGAGYILWEFESRKRAVLTLGFRNQWQYPAIPGWFGKTTERLGVPAVLHETSGAKAAREALDAALADGSPVLATVDQQTMGLWGLPPELSGYAGYPVVVTGRTDDGAYLVDDRGTSPFVVPADVMAAARGRVGSYRNRLIELRPNPGPLPADRLRDALTGGPCRPGRPPVIGLRFVLPPRLAEVEPAHDRPPERQSVATGLRRRSRPVRRAHLDGRAGR